MKLSLVLAAWMFVAPAIADETTSRPVLFPSIVRVGAAEVAPPPRAKKCDKSGTSLCLCPDGELRGKARAAIELAKPSPVSVTNRQPSPAEVEAAKKALNQKK